MIPAGSLKYTLEFYQLVETQSQSGFISKSKNKILTVKASKIKDSGNFETQAKELTNTKILIFKTRFHPLITEDLTVIHDGSEFKINWLEKNSFDNSIKLMIERINK